MKSFFYLVSKILISVIVMYPCFIFVWGYCMPYRLAGNLVTDKTDIGGFLAKKITELDTTNNVDIVFLGSSHTYRSFDTALLDSKGYKAINLGTSAQSQLHTEYFIDKYIKQLSPNIVVYDVYHNALATEGKESALNIIGHSNFDSAMLSFYQLDITVINTIIYSWWRSVLGIETYVYDKTNLDNYVKGGYVSSNSEEFRGLPCDTIMVEPKLLQDQIDAMRRNIKKLTDMNIEVYMVNTPVIESCYTKYDLSEFNSIMNNLDVSYIDYNSIVDFDKTYFFDNTHLNQKGAAVLTNYIINDVLEK